MELLRSFIISRLAAGQKTSFTLDVKGNGGFTLPCERGRKDDGAAAHNEQGICNSNLEFRLETRVGNTVII